MAIYIKPSWRRYIPHLEIYMNVPLVRINMMVMTENMEYLTFTYLGVFWRIWKWEGNVRLFEMGNKKNQMNISQDDAKIKKCGCWFSRKHALQFYCDKHLK